MSAVGVLYVRLNMQGEFKHARVINGVCTFGEIRLSIKSTNEFKVDTSKVTDDISRCFLTAIEFGITYVRNYQRRFDDWHTVTIEHVGATISDSTDAIMSYCAAKAYMDAIGESRDLVAFNEEDQRVSFSFAKPE